MKKDHVFIQLRDSDEPPVPLKVQVATDPVSAVQSQQTIDKVPQEITVMLDSKLPPKTLKDLRAQFYRFKRPRGIDRTRKRQIQKARFMDKGSYEYSQYWRKQYGKFRREATRYSKRKQAE